MKKLKKLNLGCGNLKLPKFINIDKEKSLKPDIIHDLEDRLPFDDSEIDEIVAFDILEHLSDPIKIFNEMWRVCKNEAQIKIRVPSAHSSSAHDFGHKSFFTVRQFKYLTCNSFLKPNYTGLHCNFKMVKSGVIPESNEFDVEFEEFRSHVNIIVTIQVIK